MKKENFLKQLRGHLSGLKIEEVDEIIRDQEEFIRDAMSSGRDEEEVIQSLGSPQKFAEALKLEYKVKKISSAESFWESIRESVSSVGVLIALTPINLIILFLLIIPIGTFIFSWFSTSLALLVVGVFMFFLQFVLWPVIGLSFLQFLAFFFLSLGIIFMGLTGIFALYLLLKLCVRVFVSYINWNIDLVKGVK